MLDRKSALTILGNSLVEAVIKFDRMVKANGFSVATLTLLDAVERRVREEAGQIRKKYFTLKFVVAKRQAE
jgi:hypothetical protein